MATFLQLYGEGLNRELGSDMATSTDLFTVARRKAAINEAQLEFVKQTECFTKSVSVTLIDGQQEYDLDAVISADDFLWIAKDGAEFVSTDAVGNVLTFSGEDFPRIDLPELNREQIGWRQASPSQQPTSYYIREDGGRVYLGIVPAPSITAPATASVTLPYVAVPPDMSADGDQPFSVAGNPKRSLRPWHQALVHYAAALLEPLRKGFNAEQRQRTLFVGLVADYLQRQRPKGGMRITTARDYRGEARRRPIGRNYYGDPRVRP